MEGDLLIAAMDSARRGRLAIAAGIFSMALAVATGGCGKKDAPSPSGNVPASQSATGEIPAAAPVGQGEVSVAAGDGFKVVVAPSTPSRIAPPAVSLKSPPGKGAEISSVKWLVNGEERGDGEVLAPVRLQRGDRIQAVVVLRTGGGETTVTAPEVVAVNALPAVTDVRLEPQAPISGSEVRAVVGARDPDDDPLTFKYQWHVDNAAMPGGGDTLTLKGVRKGSWVHVAVTPNDGFADGAWKSSSRYQVVNAPPVVTSKPPTTIPPSRVLSHSIVAEDPDGDPLTYTLVKGPEGATLSGATFTWKVNDRDLDRLAEVVIRISDTDGASTVLTMALNPRRP
jgi:hypothetical protein